MKLHITTVTGQSFTVDVADSATTEDIFDAVAKEMGGRSTHLKLIYEGKAWPGTSVPLQDGSKLIAMVSLPKPSTTREDTATSASRPQWTVKTSDYSLNWRKIAIYVGLWAVGSRLVWQYSPELSAIYVLVSILLIMFLNLGKRKDGELSAYSIFNEGGERLPGDGLGQEIDRQLRGGRLF